MRHSVSSLTWCNPNLAPPWNLVSPHPWSSGVLSVLIRSAHAAGARRAAGRQLGVFCLVFQLPNLIHARQAGERSSNRTRCFLSGRCLMACSSSWLAHPAPLGSRLWASSWSPSRSAQSVTLCSSLSWQGPPSWCKSSPLPRFIVRRHHHDNHASRLLVDQRDGSGGLRLQVNTCQGEAVRTHTASMSFSAAVGYVFVTLLP